MDPFLDLDDATVTGIQPDSIVPVHIPEGSEDTASLSPSMEPSFTTDFPLSEKSGYSYGTSTITHSVKSHSPHDLHGKPIKVVAHVFCTWVLLVCYAFAML